MVLVGGLCFHGAAFWGQRSIYVALLYAVRCAHQTVRTDGVCVGSAPESAHVPAGVYTPKLQVEVSCLSAGNQAVSVTAGGNSSSVAITIKARYPGTDGGALALVQQLATDACGIPRLCSPTGLRQAVLLRRWLGPASIKQGSLELSVSGSRQGNVTQVVAAALHKEQGLVADMPIFISFGGAAASSAQNVSWVCVASGSSGRSLLTCSGSNVLPRSQLVVTATAPNIDTPSQPLTSSTTYFT